MAERTDDRAAALVLKLWANSGDSHLMEPFDLFDSLPADIRERMPRSVKDRAADG